MSILKCGSLLRPAVVWFGESLDPEIWNGAEQAARRADVLVVVGTSGEVYPAASVVEHAAGRGAEVILINLEPGPLDVIANVVLHGRAADVVPQLGLTG